MRGESTLIALSRGWKLTRRSFHRMGRVRVMMWHDTTAASYRKTLLPPKDAHFSYLRKPWIKRVFSVTDGTSRRTAVPHGIVTFAITPAPTPGM